MRKSILLIKIVGGSLVLAAVSTLAHKQAPVAVEKRYSDQGVIDCIRKGTAPLDTKLAELKRKETTSKKSLISIAPLVLERRRVE